MQQHRIGLLIVVFMIGMRMPMVLAAEHGGTPMKEQSGTTVKEHGGTELTTRAGSTSSGSNPSTAMAPAPSTIAKGLLTMIDLASANPSIRELSENGKTLVFAIDPTTATAWKDDQGKVESLKLGAFKVGDQVKVSYTGTVAKSIQLVTSAIPVATSSVSATSKTSTP